MQLAETTISLLKSESLQSKLANKERTEQAQIETKSVELSEEIRLR